MHIAALLIGLLVVAQGLTGMISPSKFVALVAAFQVPPVLYFAAAVRVLVGAVLYLAAPRSRWPRVLRLLGGLIAIGGALTPFVGQEFARVILAWWSTDTMVVRAWALAAIALGTFIILAVRPTGTHE